MQTIRIIILLLLFISCKPSTSKDTDTFKLSSSLKDGELTLSVNNKTQLLKEEGTIVDFHTSADEKNMALEIEKLSTLSILKLYQWHPSTEKYVVNPTNINSVAWQNFEQTHAIISEELESSHVYFLKWKGKDSIVVELRGRTGKGIYVSDTLVLKY